MALPDYLSLCVKFIHKVSDRPQLSRINMPELCLQRITTTMQILNFNYWFVKLKGQYYWLTTTIGTYSPEKQGKFNERT